jgi:hypothetical protein
MTMLRRVIFGAVVCVACGDDSTGPSTPPAPEIEAAEVWASEHNVLSAVVSVRARHTDSVRVRFHLADESSAVDSVTPVAALDGAAATIPVLGLLPERAYLLRVVTYGAGGTVVGEPLELTTSSLPTDLPQYTATGDAPAPGYIVFAAGKYGLVIDNSGRIVWYRWFADGPGLNFMAEPTGRYVARPETPGAIAPHRWVELDPLGNITRTFGCARGLEPRFHDLISDATGGYWILCDETRIMDLSAYGGVADAQVTGTVVQHVDANGALLFEWSPFDHFAITDVEPAALTGAAVNWTHGNSLDLDADGDLLVSFRNLAEITKIDVPTGAVRWRLGGLRNEFTFVDTPFPAFSRQHGVRAYAPGALMILDNLGNAAESRAERYTIDESRRTARLTTSYGAGPGVVAALGGSVQDIAGGHTLVSYGPAGRVEEYDETGRVVWRIERNAGYIFRAQRIRSLYAPGVGTAR